MNKTIIEGFLGRDAEIRFTQNGTCIATFSVATNRPTKPKSGSSEPGTKTQWHRCVAFGDIAESIERDRHYLKGAKVHVEGAYESRDEIDSQNVKHTVWELRVKEVEVMRHAKSDPLSAPKNNSTNTIEHQPTSPPIHERGFGTNETFT